MGHAEMAHPNALSATFVTFLFHSGLRQEQEIAVSSERRVGGAQRPIKSFCLIFIICPKIWLIFQLII